MLYHEYLLLKLLTRSNSLMGINQIVDQLKITKRTAYSAISGVNLWLETHNLNKIMTVRSHGYYVQPYEINDIETQLKYDLQQGNIKLPQAIRTIAIEFALLCKKDPVSLEYLNDLNGVNTRTTQSDLAKIKKDLEKRDLKLYLINHGYSITGSEEEIRKFALQKLVNAQETAVYDKVERYLRLKTKEKLQIEQVLLTIEQNSGCYLTDESIFQVKEYICFSLKRYRRGYYLKESNEINSQKLKKSITLISSLLSSLGVIEKHLNSETQLLSKIIDSRQISKISKKIESQEMSRITTEIIRKFSVISGIDLVNDNNLHDALTTHLIAAQRRVLYNVQFLNSTSLSVKSKYPEIFFLTKKSIQPFEKYLNKTLTTDEIELIAIYFGGEIELLDNSTNYSSVEKVILVCGSGIGTSRLLKIQLEKLFQDQLQISVITKQDYEELYDVQADLVISTLPVTSKGPPIVNINRILTDYDLQNIRQHLPSKLPSLHNSPAVKATQILDIVSEYAQVKDFSGLTTALQSYFSKKNKPAKTDNSNLPNLRELLPEDRILFTSKECTWQESVKLTGKLLEQDNISNSEYTKKMCLQINKFGPYMKIMDDIMLLHAKPDEPTKYSISGMSLVCFKNPVRFSNDIMAKYVFSLYAPTSNSHLKALTQLTEIFSNKDLLKKFKKAKNAKNFIQLFEFVEKGDDKISDTTNRPEINSIKC